MRKKNDDQLTLEFPDTDGFPTKSKIKPDMTEHKIFVQMRRSVVAWLYGMEPSGIGISVPTRFSKYLADVAAFWSSPIKKRYLSPDKTLIVEIRHNREECWPDCSGRDEILSELKKKKDKKRRLEEQIKLDEPELEDNDNLFHEFESWNFSKSKNRGYHECVKEIEGLEHALYKGSRFERIRRTHVADKLYLAVPYGQVHADELADGWGLLFVKPDHSVTVAKESEEWECPLENKMHLVQNIASSCMKSVLLTQGVRRSSSGKTIFTKMPRAYRAPEKIK